MDSAQVPLLSITLPYGETDGIRTSPRLGASVDGKFISTVHHSDIAISDPESARWSVVEDDYMATTRQIFSPLIDVLALSGQKRPHHAVPYRRTPVEMQFPHI